MKTLHIFISSPGDVDEERTKARQVIEQLQTAYGADLALEPIFWEDLPLGANASFQEGIDLLLTERYTVEIAVFIIWSRLGSPLGPPLRRDGTTYRSGTEREFELMLESRRISGGKRPHILVYVRRDEDGFTAKLGARKSEHDLSELVDQHRLTRAFIRETFHDEQGRNVRAYHPYEKPVAFAARLKTHLRGFIEKAYELADIRTTRWEESPYRGLETFELEHAPIYFGRENEVCEVELLLRRRAAAGPASAVIVGPSGAGKSSLARAGVAHSLTRENLDDAVKVWRYAVMRPASSPGDDIFRSLVRALTVADALPELGAGDDRTLAAFEKLLATDPDVALTLAMGDAFRRAAEREGGEVQLLLVADQLEELWLEQTIAPETREAFLRALEALAASGRVWVLATLRADVYPLAQQSEGFTRFKRPAQEGGDCDGVFDLGPPTPASIHRLITEPARKARLRFEKCEKPTRSLDQDLLRDTVGHADALPLLEYALEELFKRRTADGLLTFAAYDALGGVEGALGKNAGQTFLALSQAARDALGDILPLLVAVDASEAQRTVRRQARLGELTATPGGKELTEALIQTRFLTTDTLDGVPVATLAHEALLRRWEHLEKWIAQNRELLQLREAVTAAASDWRREKAKHPDGADDLLLASGLPLLRGQRALDAGALDASDAQYVHVSLSREKAVQSANRRRLQMIALTSTVAAVILAFTAWLATNRARENKSLLAASDADRAERLFAEDDSAGAVWFLCRAVASGSLPPRASERLWLALTQRSWPLPIIDPVPHAAEITAVTFDPSGRRFATATRDGSVVLFDSADGKPLGVPLPHLMPVRGLRFNPEGTKLLTACDDGCARLWDVRKPTAMLLGISRHEDVVAAIAWSGDGRRYATGSWDKHLCVWDPARPEKPVFSVEMKDKVHTVAFDPRNPARVLGVARDTLGVWDVGTGVPVLHSLSTEDLGGACFSADGGKVVSFGKDGEILISDLTGGLQQWPQLALGTPCQEAVCSPDGTMFAVAFGARARVYTLAQPPEMLWEHTFPDRVSRLKFTTEGKRLLTACDDGKIQVFDAREDRSLSEPIMDPGVPVGLDFHPAGNRVLVARSVRTARVWGLSPPAPLPLAAFDQGSPPLALHLDREVECIAENGGGLAFPPPDDPDQGVQARRINFGTALVAAMVDPAGRIVASSPDGRVLATTDGRVTAVGKFDTPMTQLAVSADGKFLAAGDDEGNLARWRLPGFQPMPTAWKHADRIGALALFTPGPMLVSAAWDHRIALTDASAGNGPAAQWTINGEPQASATDPGRCATLIALSTGEVWRVTARPPEARALFQVGSPPSAVALDPDGAMAAVGTVTGTVSVRDAGSGRKICQIKCGDWRVNSVGFGNGGRWLAVGMEDGRARVYDTVSGQPVSEAVAHATAVRHVLFTPNGRALVTATRGGAVFVWPFPPPDEASRAVAIARRVMREEAAGPPFIPRTGLLPVCDAARLRRLAEGLRQEKALAPQADLLDMFLGP